MIFRLRSWEKKKTFPCRSYYYHHRLCCCRRRRCCCCWLLRFWVRA